MANKMKIFNVSIFDSAEIVECGDSIICGTDIYCAADLLKNNYLPQTGTMLVLSLPIQDHKIVNDGCVILVTQPFDYILYVGVQNIAKITIDVIDYCGCRKREGLPTHYILECTGGKAPTFVERR